VQQGPKDVDRKGLKSEERPRFGGLDVPALAEGSRPEPRALSDEQLARQTQGGSLGAFEELVRRYEGRIYAFLRRCCRSETDAREVTQDTFVQAFQAIAQFDSRRVFASWLFTVARHKYVDHQRAAPIPSGEPVPDLAAGDDPAELLARREEREDLWALARRQLPEAQFQALWLRYTEDMDVGQIAQVVHKTRTHVKVLLFRARLALAVDLERPGTASRPRPKSEIRTPGAALGIHL